MRHLRRATREVIDGFRAGLDLLLWGHTYPRRLTVSEED